MLNGVHIAMSAGVWDIPSTFCDLSCVIFKAQYYVHASSERLYQLTRMKTKVRACTYTLYPVSTTIKILSFTKINTSHKYFSKWFGFTYQLSYSHLTLVLDFPVKLGKKILYWQTDSTCPSESCVWLYLQLWQLQKFTFLSLNHGWTLLRLQKLELLRKYLNRPIGLPVKNY